MYAAGLEVKVIGSWGTMIYYRVVIGIFSLIISGNCHQKYFQIIFLNKNI